MNIGKSIRTCRIQKGIRQIDLSNKAGISVTYLSLLEKGKREINFSTLSNIANALEIPISILVFLASDDEDLHDLSPELRDKLSSITLSLMKESTIQDNAKD